MSSNSIFDMLQQGYSEADLRELFENDLAVAQQKIKEVDTFKKNVEDLASFVMDTYGEKLGFTAEKVNSWNDAVGKIQTWLEKNGKVFFETILNNSAETVEVEKPATKLKASVSSTVENGKKSVTRKIDDKEVDLDTFTRALKDFFHNV